MVQVKRTGDIQATGVKLLVYGQSGVGKTTLIKTLPDPIVLSAEAGLLSIRDSDIPYIDISSIADAEEAYKWLVSSDEAKEFQSVAIDSISEIAEVVLSAEKMANKDGRMAYMEMGDKVGKLIRKFRGIKGKHVYMSAKVEKTKDETGRILYYPYAPGEKFCQSLPYFFDEVFALRVERDSEGNVHRALMCDSDGLWLAKDRIGKLNMWEPADLGAIIRKIGE